MCGRFVRHTNAAELARLARALLPADDPGPSYNIAPSQSVLNAFQRGEDRVLESLQWGLIPRWARDEKKLHPINARAETVSTNGVFRSAFRSGRTLIPADGFYEWQRTVRGKQPFYVRRCDGLPMWFAGVSDRWQRDGRSLDTCAIVTTTANEVMRPIHDRMPVILFEDAWDLWLDPACRDTERLLHLLGPCPADRIAAYPVSTRVNSPRNDEPALLDPDS